MMVVQFRWYKGLVGVWVSNPPWVSPLRMSAPASRMRSHLIWNPCRFPVPGEQTPTACAIIAPTDRKRVTTMATVPITIEVDEQAASIYNAASPEEQKKMQLLLSLRLRDLTLKPRRPLQ